MIENGIKSMKTEFKSGLSNVFYSTKMEMSGTLQDTAVPHGNSRDNERFLTTTNSNRQDTHPDHTYCAVTSGSLWNQMDVYNIRSLHLSREEMSL